MNNVYAVILAGGKGERFWPKSRGLRPKQLLALAGKRTMLEQTLERVAPIVPPERQWVVTSHDLAAPIEKLGLEGIRVVGEPAGKNTAPAIAVAAGEIARTDPQAVMMVLPSDHFIRDVPRFQQVLNAGIRLAAKGHLATIGLAPDRPETGYGYIERGEVLGACDIPCYAVKSFREKPDAETARNFIRSGYFFWNGGIFIWKVETILAEIEKLMPDLHRQLRAWLELGGLEAGAKAFAEFYHQVEKISIDYGVMEKSKKVAVVKGDFGWDDLGSWEALRRLHKADEHGNVAVGNVVAVESTDNILVSDKGMIAVLGAKDLIVVQSGDAVLVCHQSRAQEVRKIVTRLRDQAKLKKFL